MKTIEQPQLILSLDIETLGTTERSVVTQVALIAYDLEEDEILKIRHHEDYPIIPQQRYKNRIIDGATVMWWMQQSDAAREHFKNCDSTDGDEIPALLTHFTTMFDAIVTNEDGTTKPYELYANSHSFDCVILKSLFADYDMPSPWDFRRERCLRTLCSNAGIDAKAVPHVPGFVAHDPFWDARQQIAIYLEARKAIMGIA